MLPELYFRPHIQDFSPTMLFLRSASLLFHVFNHLKVYLDRRPAGCVVQAKYPHMLSGESDRVARGFASAVLEIASDCQEALK